MCLLLHTSSAAWCMGSGHFAAHLSGSLAHSETLCRMSLITGSFLRINMP
jgi:hypothetical protein